MNEKKKTTYQRKKTLDLLRLKSKVYLMLLDSYTPAQIKAELGIKHSLYLRLYRKICNDYVKTDEIEANAAKRKRISQLEHLANKAANAWEASKESTVETTIQFEMVLCTKCTGDKVNKDGKKCQCCHGTGETRKEVKTEKIKGSAGKSDYLREHRLALDTISKIEGLSSPKKIEHTMKGQISHEHKAVISDDNQFKDATPEQISQMKKLVAEMENPKEESENDIIDVEVLNTEET